jgi:hypothetical protein
MSFSFRFQIISHPTSSLLNSLIEHKPIILTKTCLMTILFLISILKLNDTLFYLSVKITLLNYIMGLFI